MKQPTLACLFLIALTNGAVAPLHAEDAADPVKFAAAPVLTSHGLLSQLEQFLQERKIDVSLLTADAMVGVMLDWVRFSPIAGGGESAAREELVYQYGGWSEGCATGFRLSVLRRVTGANPEGENLGLTAGITLLFEPSANTRLEPYRLASSELKTIEDFIAAIERSPGFRKLAAETPMSAFIERGALR